MRNIPELQGREELAAWVKQNFDKAIEDLIDSNVVESLLLEAKPAWVFPFSILIGKVRENGHAGDFLWFICGEGPTDSIPGSCAASPREAARHFALKWQLDASRDERLNEELSERAGALYQLADDEKLWVQDS